MSESSLYQGYSQSGCEWTNTRPPGRILSAKLHSNHSTCVSYQIMLTQVGSQNTYTLKRWAYMCGAAFTAMNGVLLWSIESSCLNMSIQTCAPPSKQRNTEQIDTDCGNTELKFWFRSGQTFYHSVYEGRHLCDHEHICVVHLVPFPLRFD